MQVPRLCDLAELFVETFPSEEAGVVSVTSWANDGSVVTLTWEETASSVRVSWTEADEERLLLARAGVSKVSGAKTAGGSSFGSGPTRMTWAGSWSFAWATTSASRTPSCAGDRVAVRPRMTS